MPWRAQLREKPTSEQLLRLGEEAGVRFNLTEEFWANNNVKVFKVKPNVPVEVYIIDTDEGLEVAVKPEVVGSRFIELNEEAAFKVARFLKELVDQDETIIFAHVLRASLGYRLHTALKKLGGWELREIYLRVKYEEGSFRDHVTRRAVVKFRDYSGMPEDCSATLIVADTVATGRTLITALDDVLREARARGVKVDRLVIYGFLSEYGIAKVSEWASSAGVKVTAIALQDLTPLAYNMYDMPLYGVDESLWDATGEMRTIAAVVDPSTFTRMALEYAPGLDQPGDWSERQEVLFNGTGYEKGDVKGHLHRSLELIVKLRELSRKAPWYEPWLDEVFRERANAIARELSRL